MNVLAFDTAANACSAAVWRSGAVAAGELVPMTRGHAEALMPMVGRVMRAAGLDFAALDRVGVTVGPGAFTGLRIGLAAARGIALAARLPVAAVTTLEALAHGVGAAERGGARLLAVLDAKRADVYAQLFSERLEPLTPPRALLPAALAAFVGVSELSLVLTGDGAARAEAALAAAGVAVRAVAGAPWPDAGVVAAIAAGRALEAGAAAGPLYLRPPQAARPAHGGRLRP